MSTENVPSKGELLQMLRTQAVQVEEAVRALSDEQFEQGRYEGGWNARQILAHVASIEWTYPRLLDLANGPRESAPPRTSVTTQTPEQAAAGAAPRTPSANPIDAYNARQVEKRAAATTTELLEEFRANRAALIAAVEAADDEIFSIPVRSAGGARGPLAAVIKFVALDHVGVHIKDLSGGAA